MTDAITKKIISRDERYFAYKGRYFFAVRCSRNRLKGWRIDEINQETIHGSRAIGFPFYFGNTRKLAERVIRYVNEAPC